MSSDIPGSHRNHIPGCRVIFLAVREIANIPNGACWSFQVRNYPCRQNGFCYLFVFCRKDHCLCPFCLKSNVEHISFHLSSALIINKLNFDTCLTVCSVDFVERCILCFALCLSVIASWTVVSQTVVPLRTPWNVQSAASKIAVVTSPFLSCQMIVGTELNVTMFPSSGCVLS
ncbi:hypothetical protein BsWGS_24710 [Bradybaena similaris]